MSKILIVDDETNLRITFAAALEMMDHQILEAENGKKAIEMAKQHSPDIIFMDVRMPQMNGVEAFKEIKKINPDIKVIMMTAYAVEDLLEEAVRLGAYTIIHKPFDIEKIAELITTLSAQNLILVVDDSFADRELLKTLLELNRYKVDTAKNAEEAFEKFTKQNVNICIIDIVLPGKNGIELYEEINRMKPGTPVIFLTGYDVAELIQKGIRLGIYTCFRKPVDIQTLVSAIKNL
jgi:DNA-binding NtrC family response regulator